MQAALHEWKRECAHEYRQFEAVGVSLSREDATQVLPCPLFRPVLPLPLRVSLFTRVIRTN